jgi:hypothetical protein
MAALTVFCYPLCLVHTSCCDEIGEYTRHEDDHPDIVLKKHLHGKQVHWLLNLQSHYEQAH